MSRSPLHLLLQIKPLKGHLLLYNINDFGILLWVQGILSLNDVFLNPLSRNVVCAYFPCSFWPCFSVEMIWWGGQEERAGKARGNEVTRRRNTARGMRNRMGIEGNKRCDTVKVVDRSLSGSFFPWLCIQASNLWWRKSKGVIKERRVVVCPQTFVVLTLLPVLQLHPVRSGRTLQSSPSIHGCIWHHHFWATMEAGGRKQSTYSICTLKDSFRLWGDTFLEG